MNALPAAPTPPAAAPTAPRPASNALAGSPAKAGAGAAKAPDFAQMLAQSEAPPAAPASPAASADTRPRDAVARDDASPRAERRDTGADDDDDHDDEDDDRAPAASDLAAFLGPLGAPLAAAETGVARRAGGLGALGGRRAATGELQQAGHERGLGAGDALAGSAARGAREARGADAAAAATAALTGQGDAAALGAADDALPGMTAAADAPRAGADSFAARLSEALGMAPTGTAAPAEVRAEAADAAPAGPTPEVPLPTPLDDPGFGAALGAQVTLLVRDGVEEARLQLNPAEMGPVTVKIALDGARATVEFSADLAATRQVLEQTLPDLAAALHDQGLMLAGGGVFEPPRDGRQDPARDDGRGQPREPGRGGPAGGDAPAAGAAAPRAGARRGLLDTYA